MWGESTPLSNRWVETAIWALAIGVPVAGIATVPGREAVVEDYLAAVNRGDPEGALDRLGSEFVLRFPDGDTRVRPDEIREALEWRAAIGERVHALAVTEVDDADRRLELVVERDSELHRLLGVRPRYRVHYVVLGGRLYKEAFYKIDREDRTMRDALAPFLAWAAERHPRRLARIHRDGRMVRSPDTAGEWLALLREWREERPVGETPTPTPDQIPTDGTPRGD